MERPPTLEPGYLNLPGWRCVPVYAVPLSPRPSPTGTTPPPFEAHTILPPNIPPEPRAWSRQHVFVWLEWSVEHFSLPPIERENFFMNGRGLCLLKRNDFCERAPRSGDVLYNALQMLLQDKEKAAVGSPVAPHISASLLQYASHDKGKNPPPWSRSVSSDFHSVGHVIHASEHAAGSVMSDADNAPSPSERSPEGDGVTPITYPSINARQLSQFPEGGNSTEKINVRLLWDFLQQLLNDPQQRYECCIVWKQRERGVFKITDPQRLASLWGRQKNHLNMNFDKMSRALRYYYRVRILQKEPGERHCYRFLRHPNELRHCKQRSLLTRNLDNSSRNGMVEGSPDIEAALDMSIKEEVSSPDNAD